MAPTDTIVRFIDPIFKSINKYILCSSAVYLADKIDGLFYWNFSMSSYNMF